KARSLLRMRYAYAARGIEPSPAATQHSTHPSSSADSHRWFHHLCRILLSNSSRVGGSRVPESDVIYGLSRVFGSVLATAIGIGLVTISTSSHIAFAETNDNENHSSCSTDARSFSAETNMDMEKVVRQVRKTVEEHLQKSFAEGGIHPSFTVAAKGQRVAIRFHVPPSCDLSHLIVDVVSRLGLKTEGSSGGSEMILRAWDSAVARQLILIRPDQHVTHGGGTEKGVGKTQEGPLHEITEGNDICVLVFEPLIGSHNAEIEFLKRSPFTIQELDALTSVLIIASGSENTRGALQKKNKDVLKRNGRQNSGPKISSDSKALEALEAMGVKIYGLEALNGSSDKDVISWDNIAGYHEQKREIEDTVLLALRRPEIYDNIAKGTRCKFESNRPRAVLFEGPPGTGKTSCARVIASQAGVPLLYVPLEVVMSKYYGESERLLGSIFNLANELHDGAIIFLDE
ncbi:hypothetical protein KI387_013056, partial [Taxus chinensis]